MRGKIISFVVFSRMERTLYLHAAHLCHPEFGATLSALLRRAYDKLAADRSQFETVTVAAINMPAKRLAEKLLSGANPTRHTVYHAQKPLVRQVAMLPEWGGVLARSKALVRAMAEAGFGTSLCIEPGVLPYLVWTPRPKMEISVFYRVEDEAYTKFSLTAQWPFRVNHPETAEQLTQAMRVDPGPGLLLPAGPGNLFALCASREEGAGFLSEISIEGFLKPFFSQAERLAHLAETNSPH